MGVKEFKTGEVVAIIPAKLTSVRLPKKNIIDFFGQPLFFYSARVAELCSNIDDIYVTSESNEVLDLANQFGCQSILRPEKLSSSEITNLDVLIHAFNEITQERGVVPEFVVLLQPTHPFRFPSELERGVELLKSDPDADVLMTVLPDDRLRGEIKQGYFFPEYSVPRNKKNEPDMFFNTGSFYILRTKTTLSQGRMFTHNIIPLKLNNPEFEIDIDLESDLALAKCMMKINKNKFSFFWN
ncbi:MAG: cytidylyltransferase domain-containing protein [Cellvibrionaceae bacterium]